ncbi:G-protein coupled receptor family C group 6 member A [Xenopus tropicalis]|uniref:G-protein coupled receptor family C group 6 member A n=1 Tax=Xenopus tropicalis TaxID=8364 RepID=A0A8J1JLT8_XENTR|nr:G-protein coupled receptor family C group 6 member A [Xenopus tropicalis]
MLWNLAFLVFSSLWSFSFPCDKKHAVARQQGDIMIGGIFPIHEDGIFKQFENIFSEDFQCTGLRLRHIIDAMSMIYSIEKINNSTLLPGITLGYEIYDSCSSALKAVQAITYLIPETVAVNNSTNCNSHTDIIPTIKAVIGEEYSEMSIAISRILNIHLIPQISPSSSAVVLSDKVKFPSFLRTIPNDNHQTLALAKLVGTFGWNWVGIISTDDDYGRSAVEQLNIFFKQEGVCIAFTKIIPTYIDHPDLPDSLNNIINELTNSSTGSTASTDVVIVMAKTQIVSKLFDECIKMNITKTWIASDIWATSNEVSSAEEIKKVGTILGLNFKGGNVPGFADYLKDLKVSKNGEINKFIREYKNLRFGCTEDYIKYLECVNSSSKYCVLTDSIEKKSPLACKVKDVLGANDDYLLQIVEWRAEYSTALAVNAIAQALKNILCKKGKCDIDWNLPPNQLLNELKTGHYHFNEEKFNFDSYGDVLIDYDIIYWKPTDNTIEFLTIGAYNTTAGKVNIERNNITWHTKDNQVPFSNCSKCKPGFSKKHSDIACCYKCIECTEGYYTPEADMTECSKCPIYQWSDNGSSYCTNRTTQYLEWKNPYAVSLMIFVAIGIVAVLLIVILFIKHRDTPAVKAAGGNYTYLLVSSLLLSLMSTIFFIGQPSNISCQIRQPFYGISFTLCVSGILIKSLRILLAFESGKRGHKVVFFQPIIIISTSTFLQICICAIWQAVKCPFLSESYSVPKLHILQCNEGSYVAFSVMLGYIGLLAFICFILAYKGRKLPKKYNEARCITFSMLTYMFVWIAFIPIYMNTSDMYVSAVQVFAILASVYGVIFCHLLPVSYIVLFKGNTNNTERYMNSIRAFWIKKPEISLPQNKVFYTTHSNSILRKRCRSF